MDLKSPSEIREAYLQLLSEDSNYNSVLQNLLNKKDNQPIYSYQYTNPEDAPSYDNEQRELSEIVLDLNAINNGIIEIKNKAAELLESVNTQTDALTKTINKEVNRISDINMICGNESQYNMCIPIYVTDFNIDDGFEYIGDNVIGAKLNSSESVDYTITSIYGNGYSGNEYVYNNNKFQNEGDDRSNMDYLKDNSTVTVYEYSRLITSSKEEAIDSLINYDNKACECVITLYTDTPVCKAEILSENKDLIVKNIEISQDGSTFISSLESPIDIKNLEAIYNDSTYIYGSNIICFPYSNYIRITLSSDTIENDIIAIKDGENINLKPNTKRKKVCLNGIKLYNSDYNQITITSNNILEAGSVDKISLFSSEYIPDHFSEDKYIIYYLIINGTEYKVVPVNSGKDGIKIIKFSEQKQSLEEYIQNISETIKSVQVKITIKPYKDNETPYISNLKLCLGKDTGSIYVV